MTAQTFSNHSPAAALRARTAWMASQDNPEPLRTAGTVI